MNHEEAMAVAIVKVRLWGVHQSWLEYFGDKLVEAVEQHERAWGAETDGEHVAPDYKKPLPKGDS